VKFDMTEENGFVHMATRGGAVMMVVSAKDGVVPRYDLLDVDGTTYHNIGEYELTKATRDEVEAALRSARLSSGSSRRR
jgi:hypothetical protein